MSESGGKQEPALRVLIVEDEASVAQALARFVEHAGHAVAFASNGAEALTRVCSERYDLVLCDLGLPGALDGVDLIRAMARPGGPPIVVVTGRSDVSTAVEALQAGASEYLQKPLTPELVHRTLRRVIQDQRVPCGARAWELDTLASAQSPAMRQMLAHVARSASTRAHVLLVGESGTGKGVVARLLHDRSPRAEQPFVRVHAASLARAVDAVLFGDERTAGVVTQADHGTLLLDTVDEIPGEAQSKLLRVLETSKLYRGGASDATSVDVRVVATTATPSERALRAEGMRTEFYYRVAEDVIRVPPLRARAEDIIPLATRFLERVCRVTERARPVLRDDARRALVHHDWPGNVRELRHVTERAALLAKSEAISARDLIEAGLATIG